MKSERRHKLQENALAHSLENLPKMGKESGSKLLLGIVTALLIVVLIRYYLISRENKRQMIAAELADARYALSDLNSARAQNGGFAELTPEEQRKLLDDIEKKVDAVQAETDDPALLAQARNIRADAFLQSAILGNPPGSTTRPDLALAQPADKMLEEAARTYQEVLDTRSGLPPAEAADAHFGLGAIDENRRDWDKARTEYEAVEHDGLMPKTFTDYAALRLHVLEKISQPFIIGTPMAPETQPAATLPSTGPASTQSAAPTTGPTPAATSAPPALPTTQPAAGPTTHAS